MSTMKAKIIALDTKCTKRGWLKKLLSEMPLVCKSLLIISIHCYFKVVIVKCKQKNSNLKMNRRLKDIHKSIMYLDKHCIIYVDFVKIAHNHVD